MPSINSTVGCSWGIGAIEWVKADCSVQVFHAYAYGTAFWYGLRGLCRVYDPIMVIGCTFH